MLTVSDTWDSLLLVHAHLELVCLHLGVVMFVCGQQRVIVVCMWTPGRHYLYLNTRELYLSVDMWETSSSLRGHL